MWTGLSEVNIITNSDQFSEKYRIIRSIGRNEGWNKIHTNERKLFTIHARNVAAVACKCARVNAPLFLLNSNTH